MRFDFQSAAAAALTLVLAAPAIAQTGNASDVTGPLATGSEIAAVGAPVPPSGGINPVVLAAVSTTALDIASQLGSVQVQADGSFAQTVSQSNVLAVAIGVDPPAVLAQALGGSPQATELANAMDGLLLDPTPEQVTAAVRAFNSLVMTADAAYLSNPPAEFVVVQSVLATLVTAARSA